MKHVYPLPTNRVELYFILLEIDLSQSQILTYTNGGRS